MLKCFKIRTFFIICALICHAKAVDLLDTYQLPLSQKLLKTFPKITVKCFIIAVPKLRIILHGQNLTQHIRCGDFSQIISSIASLTQESLMPDVDKFLQQYGRKIPKYTDIAVHDCGISILLQELCNLFEHEYLYILKKHCNKYATNNIKMFFFYSKKNIGCMCRCTNINNVVFDIVIYGNKKQSDILRDINLIVQWLDRFTIQEVAFPLKNSIYIPIFYGNQSFLQLSLQQSYELLVEKNKTEQVVRTIRYLARIPAPINPTDNIGYVFYKYSIFQNPVRFSIYSNASVSKSNVFKNLADSICYIVYNRPYNLTCQ